MAYYYPRKNKQGKITSVRICINTPDGQMYTSYKPEYEGMTEEQILNKARIYGASVDSQLKKGASLTADTPFRDAAEYFISLGMTFGNSVNTAEYYHTCMKRINDPDHGFGDMAIGKITTGTINMFVRYLATSTSKQPPRAHCIIDMRQYLADHDISIYAFAKRAKVSEDTVRACRDGRNVNLTTAEKICSVYGDKVMSMFEPVEAKPISASFMNDHITFIRSVFKLAVNEHVLMFNPCDSVRRFKEPPDKRAKALSIDEVRQVFECLENEENLEKVVFTLLLIFTGARKGEICGLKWVNVNFETGEIYLCNNLYYTKTYGTVEGPLKTDRNRTVTVDPVIIDVLKHWKRKQEEQQRKSCDWRDEGFVFSGRNGGHIFPDTPTDWVSKLSDGSDLPHIYPHMFRHTHASILIALGEDVATVSSRLGHSSVATTTRIYLHALEGKDKNASALFTRNVLKDGKLALKQL